MIGLDKGCFRRPIQIDDFMRQVFSLVAVLPPFINQITTQRLAGEKGTPQLRVLRKDIFVAEPGTGNAGDGMEDGDVLFGQPLKNIIRCNCLVRQTESSATGER